MRWAAARGTTQPLRSVFGALPGDVVVSIGTSGTVFAVCDHPSADPSGVIAGFADATGRFLPLVCTLNAARVLEATARLLGVDQDQLSSLALEAPAGADGLVVVPYLEGERTPNRPFATGAHPWPPPQHFDARTFRSGRRRRHAVRPCRRARRPARSRTFGAERVILIGGGSRSEAVRRIAPGILGRPVIVPAAARACCHRRGTTSGMAAQW